MALPTETVEQLSSTLDLFHYLEPVNREAERERFYDAVEDGEAYNPSYEYRAFAAEEPTELLAGLADAAETGLEQRLVAAIRGRLAMMQAIGSPDVTDRSRSHYGSPGPGLVSAAREMFTLGDDDAPETVDGRKLKEAFDRLFEEVGISYGCELVDADIIRNNPREKQVQVPRDKQYTVAAAKRLLVHETTHSVRTVNGLESGDTPLVYGTAGYEVAEEGLATFNEKELGAFRNTLPRITARVIAVAAAEKSFHALYRDMRELGLDRRAAYIRTYRVKRGLVDTAEPGGFIKDHIYFQGYSRLADDPDLADRLYVGKIGFDDIDAVDTAPAVSRDDHIAACKQVAAETLT